MAGPYIIPQARSVGFEGYVMGPDGYDGLKLTGDKSQYNKTYYTTHYSADDNTNTKVQDFIKSYKSKNKRRAEHVRRSGLRHHLHDQAGHREGWRERHP